MPTKKKTTAKWTSREVRDLITEIITFQDDSVQNSVHALLSNETPEDRRLTREQAAALIVVLESTLKDSAYKVLASKKL
tara:strand:+ start:89 stop:325 length:237 start_codon:yes stop_codon:yes gene_type:complete